MSRPHILKKTGIFFAAAALVTLAACGGGKADTGQTTIRFGDQQHSIETLLKYSGEDANTPYTLQFANFPLGPPIIAAQTGGSIDLGYMAETPVVFAQGAGSPVKVVAVLRSSTEEGSPYAIVVRPDSPIKSVADLKGKAIAYEIGTITHYMVARLLEREGWVLSDIQTVQSGGAGSRLLDNGGADAVVLSEPVLTRDLDEGNLRVLATGARPITPGFYYLVASDAALADPEKSKAIGDFIARTVRAEKWRQENVEQSAVVLAENYRVNEELAKKIIRRNPQHYVPIDDSIIADHQKEADLFFAQGLLRTKLDARLIFDDRYNDIVAAAGGGT